MQITQTASCPRVDVALLDSLIDALYKEWQQLEFSSDGMVVNPETDSPSGALQLTGGSRKARDAHYLATVDEGKSVRF